MMVSKTTQISRVFLFCVLAAALSPIAGAIVLAQSPFANSYEEVLERAKREGELRLWWEVPGERGIGAQFEAAFKKRFGFVPRVHLTPVTNPDSLVRFLTEARLGRIDADLLYAGAADIAGRPERLKLFEDIDAPLTKIFSPKFPGVNGVLRNVESWKRPFSVDVTTLASGMIYNTKKTNANELPKTYEEFAQGKGFAEPKWKGNFAINTIGPASPLTDMGVQGHWDLEKQKKVLTMLLANKPLIKRSSGDVRMAVALGEVAAATGNIGGTEGLRKEGYPIQYKLFEDVLTVGSIGMTIPKGAKSPNMALLYLAFILEDGLPIVERISGEGTFVDPRSQLAKAFKAVPKAKVLEWTPEEILAGQRDKIRKALQALMP
ncbi:MAG TPA: extracellular solute-binding protein [Candidatus Binatia bacterium]|nr:extracellular solute-binding protein [Candidatus Binatia bacterium]